MDDYNGISWKNQEFEDFMTIQLSNQSTTGFVFRGLTLSHADNS